MNDNTSCVCGLPWQFHITEEHPRMVYRRVRGNGAGEYWSQTYTVKPEHGIMLMPGDWEIYNGNTGSRMVLSLASTTTLCNTFKMDNLRYLEDQVNAKVGKLPLQHLYH